ncbi:MAG TPA: nucleotide sugar dehydrogenase [Streptosporangiaceae bacterium]|nr:nucleotide sugar dehydrogenase [Streptosporangiaceae bacterium]
MRFLPAGSDPKVAVVGFGYVGCCVGVTLAEAGISVSGVDSDPRLIGEMRAGHCRFNDPGLADALGRVLRAGTLALSTGYEDVPDADVIIISVGTPVDAGRRVVTDYLESACSALADQLRAGQLVILKSTVAPGTTEDLVRPLLEKGGLVQGRDFGLAFCPERLAEGNALAQFRTIPMVIGACDPDSALAASTFWARALGVAVLQFASPQVAELVKLTDNWWIDANVALANELAMLCGALGVDVLDVIAGANSLPKGDSHVNVLLPGVGVGGSCLTKDPWILWGTARDHGQRLTIAQAARQVNDEMPGYTHDLILASLADLGKDPASSRVAVLGLAFKNNTNDLRHTPVRPVVQALARGCGEVRIYDPLVTGEAALAEFGLRQAPSFEQAVADADCVAVLAGHEAFQAMDFADLAGRVRMPCLIVDGRAYYRRERIEAMRALGFGYRGIGR